MHCYGTIETSMNGASFDVRTVDVTIHMKMNGISTHTVSLTRIVDLNVVEMCSCEV